MEITQAKQLLLEKTNIVLEKEEIVIDDARGRVLAESITAPFSVPSFPKSAMDGYAVKASDVEGASRDNPVVLKVVDELLAGDTKNIEYTPNTAVRVMTGAMVPDGYDAVVMQEKTDYGMESVEIYDEVKPWSNYCKVGEDIEQNEVVLCEGEVINRGHIGIMASLGIGYVSVREKLKVGILSTGSELMDVKNNDTALPVGKIYNSISQMLKSDLRAYNIDAKTEIASDDAGEIEGKLLEMLSTCHIVITTGGVSVGKRDLLPEVLDNIGACKVFQRVNIKPGTPTIGSLKDGKPILSLSGNPYAALCNFDYYFWDLASYITGDERLILRSEVMEIAFDYPKVEKKTRLIRGRVVDNCFVGEDKNESSVISNMKECNSYGEIEANKAYRKGDNIKVYFMKG